MNGKERSMNARTLVPSLVTFLAVGAAGCCYAPGDPTPAASSPGAPAAAPAAAPVVGQSASCDVISAMSTCRDMGPQAFVLGEDLVRSLCAGTYQPAGTCPTANLVGSCDEGAGTLRRYYSSGGFPYTADTARQDCQILPGNTFVPN